MFDLILAGGVAALPSGIVMADIGIRNGKVARTGDLSRARADMTIDCRGLHILPGVIDTQVHFREPGPTHKEDLESGSRAAVMGGVTAVFEMPNTNPNTDTPEALADKVQRARGRMWCDHAFFMGATLENAPFLGEWERLPGCAGIKVFMGSSTGSLLLDDEAGLEQVLGNGFRRVAVHCEDETRLGERRALYHEGDPVTCHPQWRDDQVALMATERLIRLARQAGRKVHVLHVTTAGEMDLLQHNRDIASVEVTPQHLTLSAPDCYERLGTLAQMNPPLRDENHRLALWRALDQGGVDVIGSDHAPHTLEEKNKPWPSSPSGMPGVQTLVPVMLDHVNKGHLSLERFVDLTSAGPARLYDIAGKGRIAGGYDADFTIVDMGSVQEVDNTWIESKCGWSPFAGCRLKGWPVMTVIRGQMVMQDGELLNTPSGQAVRFHPLQKAGG